MQEQRRKIEGITVKNANAIGKNSVFKPGKIKSLQSKLMTQSL